MIAVLMGVSGSGKTTIGERLAVEMGWPFYDGDDFHPRTNIEKMRGGVALTDEDRGVWLDRLRDFMRQLIDQEKSAIVACSALKEAYRRRLKSGSPHITFVYLKGDFDLIQRRMQDRAGHFMKAGLLESQFETLEEPDDAVTVDIANDPATVVRIIKRKLSL
ncbi:MAG: gluconokinase [Deltaproteobacteria bacterium]|nr:gluconokinase [Deltaproteobacteria bacterium]